MEKKNNNSEFITMLKNITESQMQERIVVADFAPKQKKKLTIKDKFLNLLKKFTNKVKISKLLIAIKNWYRKTFTEPIRVKKAKIEKEKYIKELKSNFSKKFNVDVEKAISTMNSPEYSPPNIDNNQLLIENRLDINKRKSMYKFAPFIYDVDIVDVHNENLNPEYPSINELTTSGDTESLNLLDKQLEFFNKRPHLTVGGRKRSGKLY
jgi:hypothetical protein